MRAAWVLAAAWMIAAPAQAETQEYLYLLKAARPAMLAEGLTPAEEAIAGQHAAYLEELSRKGAVILYGRTQNSDESAFGIVVFRAASREEAEAIMAGDPGVKLGLMTATLFPYKVAFIERAP